MNKGLEALNRLFNQLINFDEDYFDNNKDIEDKELIEKSLRALEIIENKSLHWAEISLMQSDASYEDYCVEMDVKIGIRPMIDSRLKNEEEYELLKEILK